MSASDIPPSAGLFGTTGRPEDVIRAVDSALVYVADAFTYTRDLHTIRVAVTPDPNPNTATPTIFRIEEFPARGQGFRLVPSCTHEINAAGVSQCEACEHGVILPDHSMNSFMFKPRNLAVIDWLTDTLRACNAHGLVLLGEAGTQDLEWYVHNRPEGLVPPPLGRDPVSVFIDTLGECVAVTAAAIRNSNDPFIQEWMNDTSYTLSPESAPQSDWIQILAPYRDEPGPWQQPATPPPSISQIAGPSEPHDRPAAPLNISDAVGRPPALSTPHHGQEDAGDPEKQRASDPLPTIREQAAESAEGQRTPRPQSRNCYWDPVEDSSTRTARGT